MIKVLDADSELTCAWRAILNGEAFSENDVAHVVE